MEGLPSPPPGHLPNPGTEAASPALAAGFFTTEPPKEPWRNGTKQKETKTPKDKQKILDRPSAVVSWFHKLQQHGRARTLQVRPRGGQDMVDTAGQALLTARAQTPRYRGHTLLHSDAFLLVRGSWPSLARLPNVCLGGSSLGTVKHSALSKTNSRETKHKGQQLRKKREKWFTNWVKLQPLFPLSNGVPPLEYKTN